MPEDIEKDGDTWFTGYGTDREAHDDCMRLFGACVDVRREHFGDGFAVVVPTAQATQARTVLGR